MPTSSPSAFSKSGWCVEPEIEKSRRTPVRFGPHAPSPELPSVDEAPSPNDVSPLPESGPPNGESTPPSNVESPDCRYATRTARSSAC